MLLCQIHGGGDVVAKSCSTLTTPWTVAPQAPVSKTDIYSSKIPKTPEIF